MVKASKIEGYKGGKSETKARDMSQERERDSRGAEG